MTIQRRRTDRKEDPPHDAAQSLEQKFENSFLLLWHELPAWLQDNHFIRSGYRPASGSYAKSFASLGYLHNETVNIYTHLIGAIVFVASSGMMYKILGPRYATASTADMAAFGCFFIGAALCLGMSATYHTISNHSHSVSSFGNKLDYVGIVLLTSGSFIGSVYYGFFCEPGLQELYWTMITAIGMGCIAVSIMPRFRTPAWRPFRAGMFVSMGLSAIFPVLHGWKLYGFKLLSQRMGLLFVLLEGFLYIVGAAIYAARVPESIRPGCHDIWGSSHQIFHVLVVMAASSHLMGLVKAFDYRHGAEGLIC